MHGFEAWNCTRLKSVRDPVARVTVVVEFEHKSDGCRFEAVFMHYGFFILSATFQTYCPNLTSLAGCRTWCPTDLQHLCCKALINKFAEWCLHCGSTLVECIFRIFLQVLFTLALFAWYCALVLQWRWLNKFNSQIFKCNWRISPVKCMVVDQCYRFYARGQIKCI